MEKLKVLAWVSAALLKLSPPSMNRCSSSSPAQRVGRVGNSAADVLVNGGFTGAPDPTVRFRGSQKSKSCSEMTDRG